MDLIEGFESSVLGANLMGKYIEPVLLKLCNLYADPETCKGTLKLMAPLIYENLIKKTLNPRKVCNSFFICPKEYWMKDNFDEYAKKILADKPPKNIPVPKKHSIYKAVHFSDIHADMDYLPGSNANCNAFICCHKESGTPVTPKDAAKYWGSNEKCAVPYRTIEQAIKSVADFVKPELIIWTGDTANQDMWEHKNETQLIPTKIVTEYFTKYLPNSIIIPIFGNHDVFPNGNYKFHGMHWMHKELVKYWGPLIGEEAKKELEHQGFYSVYHKSYNLRFIALNTEACDAYNFNVLSIEKDPEEQLIWLHKTLLRAEMNKEDVIIIGHVPPGDDTCSEEWSKRYCVLVERFQNIIRGQFFGHTHMSEVSLQKSYDKKDTIGLAVITPSFTPSRATKLSYDGATDFSVYDFDRDTNSLTNIYIYRMLLSEANSKLATQPPLWSMLYDYLSEYDLKDLSLESMVEFSNKLKKGSPYLKKYVNNYKVRLPWEWNNDKMIAKKHIAQFIFCQVSTGIYEDFAKCMGANLLYMLFEKPSPQAGLPTTIFWIIQKALGKWHQHSK